MTITSLLIWNVEGQGGSKKRYFVVGANRKDSSNVEKGQVIAFTRKKNESQQYEFRRIDVKATEHVTALCPMGKIQCPDGQTYGIVGSR